MALEVEIIYFYGASCSYPELNAILEVGLRKVFMQAEFHVDHDLTACALATYNSKPSISCTIRAGSNSCYFDGESNYEEVPALGDVLGDEGSGSYFGKRFLRDFLYKRLPEHLSLKLLEKFGLTKDIIVDNIYMKPNANVYIASFMQFIALSPMDKYICDMVFEGFKKFMDIHVCCYKNYKSHDVHFIGSLAFLFKKELLKAAKELEVKIGQVIQKPIEGLVNYHLNHILV